MPGLTFSSARVHARTEVGTLPLQLAFEQLGVHRIETLIEASNERILDEHWIDTEVCSLLEGEWRAR